MDLTFVLLLIAIIYLSEKKVDTKILVGLGVGGLVLIGYSGSMEGAGCDPPKGKKCQDGCTYKAKVDTPSTCTKTDKTDKKSKACPSVTTKTTKATCEAVKGCSFKSGKAAATCTGTPTVSPPVSPDCGLYEEHVSPSKVSPGGSPCKTDWLMVVGTIIAFILIGGGVSYAMLSKKKSPISSK